MFEQTFVQREGGGVKPWTLLVSLVGQSLLIGGALLLPLIYTYEIPLHGLANAILLAPPPPPPPPAPADTSKQRPEPVQAAPTRFEQTLLAPREVPQQIAVVEEAAAAAGPTLGGMAAGVPGGVAGGILDLSRSNAMTILPPAPIRVGGNVQAARIVSRAMPAYPAEASEQRLGGTVHLEATVTKEGTIRSLIVLDGHPVLAEAAMEAVRQWRYRPTRLNGIPVEVITSISITFKPAPLPEPEPGKKRRKKRK